MTEKQNQVTPRGRPGQFWMTSSQPEKKSSGSKSVFSLKIY